MIDLNQYVCSLPFVNLELHDRQNFMCCPSWLTKHLDGDIPLEDLWNSDKSIEIRKTMMDGSFKHCDKTQCPYLSQLISTGGDVVGPIYHKTKLPDYITDYYNNESGKMSIGPKIIQMSFDRSCNLKCPSCRVDMIMASSGNIKKIQSTIDEIERLYSNDITDFYITGSGDPFVSVGFKNFLRNFDSKKYPKLKRIHLHTNATMWNKEMWDSMKKIHKYVKSCEISIDASTKETYENVTRIGGKWDVLINNLKFIATIPNLKYVKPSFVVQSTNYKEMLPFTELMKSIFGKKANIFFGKINNWGTFTEEQFKELQVWNESHPNYQDFVNEFNRVCLDDQVFHNMQEFVITKKHLV